MAESPEDQWQVKGIVFIYTNVLLLQILLGCWGNIMNLVVLLHKKMRSRTNLLFAAMAFADLAFLLSNTFTYMFFAKVLKPGSVEIFKQYKHIPNGMMNWFSAMSIWFMIYATVERVSVIRSPFRVTKNSISPRFTMSIVVISIAALGTTGIHFLPKNTRDGLFIAKFWIMFQALTVVILPCILSTVLNLLLIFTLKKNKFQMHALADNNSFATQQLVEQRNRCERKVTFMVVVISTSFLVCNAPGAIFYILRAYGINFKHPMNATLFETVANSLAVTGKVLNFVLFCFSSEHFRNLLKARLRTIKYCAFPSRQRRSSSKMHSHTGRTLSVPLTDI